MVPQNIVQWISQNYPKPTVDPDWLEACYQWILDELHLNPASQLDEIIANVETQLLESDLGDSMLRGTGLPTNLAAQNNVRLRGPPVLVEIVSITEIASSAFSLLNVRQTRVDREDLAGLGEDDAAAEDEGPIPRYPRGMLRMELSDGSVTLPAIEYRSLPQLQLGETPLGFKMVLNDVQIRRGIAFLEPANVMFKGHKTDERDSVQDADFVRGLFRRMGKPDPPPPGAAADAAAPPQNPPPPGPGAAPQVIAPPAHVRSPLRELSEPPDMFPNGNMDYDDDEDELPRKRRVPNPTPNSNVPPPSEPPATGTTLVPSPYFGSNMASSSRTRVESSQLSRVLSPTRREPIVIEDDSSMEVDLLDVQTRASTQVPNTQRTSGKAGVVEPSSDFDYGDIDDAFLAEVEQVERQAIDAEVTASQTRVSRGTTPAVAHPPLQSRVAGHVITIDDEDEDDKENVPLPKRRVRRRLVGESGVIDISD